MDTFKIKRVRIVLGCLCLLIGIGSWIGMLTVATQQKETNAQYFNSIGISLETIRIPINSGVSLSAYRIYSSSLDLNGNGTVPTVLHINGVNNRKENHFEYYITLAQLGFEVFVLEPRGHGQTETRSTFYAYEPLDVSSVIDYLDVNYSEINSTHIAASGFSFGSGIMLLAQALDPRIYCEVLFHPPLNLGEIVSPYGIVTLFGEKFFDRAPYGSSVLPLFEDRSAWNVCNASNTQNLLLIQGAEDGIINATKTIEFIAQLKSTIPLRNDIQLIVRPGLDHVPNEFDKTSRKYMMAWFQHFYFNYSVDIAQLETEIQYQTPFSLSLDTQDGLITKLYEFGVIFTELGAIMFVLVPYWAEKIKVKLKSKTNPNDVVNSEIEFNVVQCKSFLLVNGVMITSVSLITSIIMHYIFPNIMIGALYVIPWSCLILSLIVYQKWMEKHEIAISSRSKSELLSEVGLFFSLIAPLYLGILLFDWAAIMSLNIPIWPWKGELFGLIVLIGGLLYWCYYCTDHVSLKTWWYWIGMMVIYSASTALYLIWNPFPEISLIPNTAFVWILGFGIVMVLFAVGSHFLSKIVKKAWIGAILVPSIIVPIILDRFLNFLL